MIEQPAGTQSTALSPAHSEMIGAVKNLGRKSRAALIVITDDGEGADYDVIFFDGTHLVDMPVDSPRRGLDDEKMSSYLKLGILTAGVSFVQADMFEQE